MNAGRELKESSEAKNNKKVESEQWVLVDHPRGKEIKLGL